MLKRMITKNNLHLLKVYWTLTKIFFLYFGYWLVGMAPEEFYIKKANYFMDLQWFDRAAPNYKKALRENKSARVHLALGLCLMKMGQFEESVQHFRLAHKKINQPDVVLGLAITEYETGNFDRSRELVQQLEGTDPAFYKTNDAALKKLKKSLQKDAKK